MRSNVARRVRAGRLPLAAWMAAAAIATLGTEHRVRASGLDEGPAGAIALGRAANDVRVSDYLATWRNPANLALLSGNDLGAELRLPFFQGCFDRAKDNRLEYLTPDPSNGLMAQESFANVCNDAAPMPTGSAGFGQAFDSGWGYGAGFFTPSIIASQAYGSDTLITRFPLEGEVFPTTREGTSTGNRFLLIERHVLGGFLMGGLGAQPIPELRFGLSAGIGVASLQNVNVGSVQGGTFLDQEVLIDLRATDWVIPRLTSSVVVAPLDGLELMAAITYQDDIHAKGHVDITANGVRGAPLKDCRAAAPGPHCRIEDVKVSVPWQPLEATLGIRYAQRRGAPRQRALDPIKDEVWDVEIDGYWSQTSHVDRYVVTLYSEAPGPDAPKIAFSSAPAAVALALPKEAAIARHWKDTFGVRIGGDYAVLPARLALRLGVSFEDRAVPVDYMSIDAWPVNQVGLYAGLTFALDRHKFTLGYAHIFFQEVDVGVGAGKVTEIVSQSPSAALPVNEGHYRASLDILSVQANTSF